MSRDLKNKKKSTSKYRNKKVSPLIPVIAVIEVLVLIIASTYAWFSISSNKKMGTGIITVDADSGLDIDFKYANTTDRINIWNYVDENFTFEPATSIDGRNIFFPTSGTFGGDTTQQIVFREGTVNDVNTKYLSIDFELTNTSDSIMDVYLKNTSTFMVKSGNDKVDSKALRMAFYPNDGSKGDVRSNMFGDSGATSSSDQDMITVYYDNWDRNDPPYIYVWNSASENGGDDTSQNSYTEIAAYPGSKMTHVGDSIYSFTFNKNYDMCIFNNGSSGDANKLTGNLYTIDNQIYNGKAYHTYTENGTTKYLKVSDVNGAYGEKFYGVERVEDEDTGAVSYTPSREVFRASYTDAKYKFSNQCTTVYFTKPTTTAWNDAYVYIWDSSDGTAYRSWPGSQMKHVGADVYSYSFYSPSARVVGDIRNYDKIIFNNGFQTSEQDASKKKQSDNTALSSVADMLFYFPNNQDSGSMRSKSYDSSVNTIYFYNSFGWTTPSIKANFNNSVQDVALASLTGNVYYCTLPTVYDSFYFYDKDDTSKKTVAVPGNGVTIQNGYIYRPTDRKSGSKYIVESFSYDTYTSDGAYAVISPGVSAGFQRSYNPVVAIDNLSGAATQFVPAFSSSIDNYIYGSDNPLFYIEPNHMISLSMIVWLEGTDADCGNLYSKNNIDIYLEFTTVNRKTKVAYNNSDMPNYKYRFIDATRELWTSDRQATASGITVSPVMQLYDKDKERGYLMKAASTSDYQGLNKVNVWECLAPKEIASHNLEFRRVNPYDETEVWNYWDCGSLLVNGTPYPGAMTIGTDQSDDNHQLAYVNIATFTAFADGAPPSGKDVNGDTMSGACPNSPPKSCGGLWGSFATTTMTVIDNTDGILLKNGGSNASAVTMCYTYKYSNSISKIIEYKASGYKNTAYYFVVPSNIVQSGQDYLSSDIEIRHYKNFDGDYALNIDAYNPDVTFNKTYTIPVSSDTGITGRFGQVTSSTNSSLNYWGSDVLYVQCQGSMQSSMNNDAVRIRYFTKSNCEITDSSDKAVRIYSNSQFNTSGGTNTSTNGYVCVIPNDKNYQSYRVERVSSSNATNISTTVYNSNKGYNLETHTTESVTSGSGTSRTYYVNAVNSNICTLEYFMITIYFRDDWKWESQHNGTPVVQYSYGGKTITVNRSGTGTNGDFKTSTFKDIPATVAVQFRQGTGDYLMYSEVKSDVNDRCVYYHKSGNTQWHDYPLDSFNDEWSGQSPYDSMYSKYNNSEDWP